MHASKALSGSGLPEEILYPGLDIKWYPQVLDRHPSLFDDRDADDLGIQRPIAKAAPAPVSQPAAVVATDEELVVAVETASCFRPARCLGQPPGSYRVSAYYQREAASDVVEARKTRPKLATPNDRNPKKIEQCIFEEHIRLPFRRKEQFVMVAIYRVSLPVDVLVGEVTVPVADPRVEKASVYSLMLNFEEQGEMRLSLDFPSSPATTPTGAGVPAVGAADGLATQGHLPGQVLDSPTHAAGFIVGEAVEYFSTTGHVWTQARVSGVEGHQVTICYGERQNTLDTLAPDLSAYLRRPTQATLGSICVRDRTVSKTTPENPSFLAQCFSVVGWPCHDAQPAGPRCARSGGDWETMTFLLQAA